MRYDLFTKFCASKLLPLSVLGVVHHHLEDGGNYMYTVHVKVAGKDHLIMGFYQGSPQDNGLVEAWLEPDVQDLLTELPSRNASNEKKFNSMEEGYNYLVAYLLENREGITRALNDVFENLRRT